MKPSPGVMHLVDSLALGGTERVAVNLANSLPRDRYRAYLCATRGSGPLAQAIDSHVGFLELGRRHTCDAAALRRLAQVLRQEQICLLHAHSSALFVAAVASLLPPFPKVIWHDHYGRYAIAPRRPLPFWLLTRRAAGVIAVNQPLAQWSRQVLRIHPSRVRYIPNFVCEPVATSPADLPGAAGSRIVCVANLRPEKDHLTLLRAMAQVIRQFPRAQLLLVGAGDPDRQQLLLAEQRRLGLERNVACLGLRDDIPAILGACDIGVLSSASEGLPLALIEYGMAGLPAVATSVGQCAEVLDDGQAGLLAPPGQPAALADALLALLRSPDRRSALGERLRQRVRANYSAEAVVGQVCAMYDAVLVGTSEPRTENREPRTTEPQNRI
jgi:glycosyltransferase involved in cell wall biosynthesis